MNSLNETAPAFVRMAHQIVWCSAATVDAKGRPRSRVLHPIWQWQHGVLSGWIATAPTPLKRRHLEAHPWISLNYWTESQDTCVAECQVEWGFDDAICEEVWQKFKTGPAPVGYDPAIIPGWDGPQSENFAVLILKPWLLRVFPGSLMLGGEGKMLVWQAD